MIAGRATSTRYSAITLMAHAVALALLARRFEHRDPGAVAPGCSACAQRPSAPRGPLPYSALGSLGCGALRPPGGLWLYDTRLKGISPIDVVGEFLRVCETSQKSAVS